MAPAVLMPCPDPSEMALFVRGELSLDDLSHFEAHLDRCQRCLKFVARISDQPARTSSEAPIADSEDGSAFSHLLSVLARGREEAVEPATGRERFGEYVVAGVLGRGAMGVVYRAVHEKTGQTVAIKTVAARSPQVLESMRQEIAALERLRHPGVVSLLDSGVIDGDPWCAMELLEGRTLEDFNCSLWTGSPGEGMPRGYGTANDQSGPTRPAAGGHLKEVISLFTRICTPLAFVHRAGIVHCDLKPANIFLRDGVNPVLMDFGLRLRAGGSVGRESLEVGGRLRGTIPYLSPELIRGLIPDARADLYSLGCIFYEALTGRPPFVARTASAYLDAHLRRAPSPPSELVTEVSSLLDELVLGLLAKRPSDRIGDADVVAETLSRLEEAPSSNAPSPRRSTPYLFRPRLVGREEVLSKLVAIQGEAIHTGGRVVLIRGESGIGKTFLASELAQIAGRAGFDVVTGECAPLSAGEGAADRVAGSTLEPFRTLIRTAADRCRGGGPAAALDLFGSARTIALLARYESAISHLAAALAPEDIASLPPTAERERVLQALADVVDRMTREAPLCLLLDDVQWADDLSLAFLALLASTDLKRRRLLVVALYRAEEATKEIQDLERAPNARSLSLARLDLPALRVLVGDLLSERPPDAFVRALAVHSEGNPFFVAEYLRAAAAEGVLERTAAGWRLRPNESRGYSALVLPPSLHVLLQRRLSLLSAQTRGLVEAAAVLGREFPVAMLAGLIDGDDGISRCIEEMLLHQVMERTTADGLRFVHDKLREAAYASIESERRLRLHIAAARLIESTFEGTPDFAEHYAELAYHLRRGGDALRAVDYFERAGENALQNSANADAVRFFRAAQEESASSSLPISPARRALWERRMGDALLGIGQLAASIEHLRASVTLLGYSMPSTARGTGLALTLAAAEQAFHRAMPARLLRLCASPRRDVGAAARACERLLQAYYYSGDYANLLFANLATLNLAELQAPSPTLTAAYCNAAMTASILPAHRLARLYFRLAERTLTQSGGLEVNSYLRLVRGVYDAGIGNWNDALASNLVALELADRLGFRRRWDEAAGVRAWLLSRHLAEECLDWAQRLFESAHRRGDTQMMSWGLLGEAILHVRRGDMDGVRQLLDRHHDAVPDPSGPELIQRLGLCIALGLAKGQLEEALGLAGRTAALVRQAAPIHLHCVDAYAAVAEAALAQRKAAGPRQSRTADAGVRAALSTLGRAASIFPVAFPRYLLLRGAHCALTEDRRGAVAQFRRSLRSALALGARYDEACALHALGNHLTTGSTEAGTARARAATLFAELRVRPESLACFV